MFKFLKRLQQEALQASPKQEKTTKTEKTVNQIIEEIHENFETASEKLLQEAKDIINQINPDEYKLLADRLGFSNSKGVRENNEVIRLKEEKENLAKLIMYYSTTYPLYKFITEKEISKICNKYNLVFGPARKYKGEIPIKNLLEIQKFTEWKSNIKPEDGSYIRRNFFGTEKVDYDIYIYRQENVRLKRDFNDTGYIAKEDFFSICAPIKDMQLDEEDKIVNGWKIEREISDPVVLYPVRGGYLIVSKWGLEGEDPSLTNEKMN